MIPPNTSCSGPALALLASIVWVVRPGRAAELHVRRTVEKRFDVKTLKR